MSTFALAETIGTAQLYFRVPETPPAVNAVRAISHGADNFNAFRKTRAPRRADCIPGVWEQHIGGLADVTLEAFGETAEQLQAALDRYLESYSHSEFRTRFAAPEIIDGEHIARGSRYSRRVEW